MQASKIPDVHYAWHDVRVRGALARPTDVAGFVGYAERGPLHEPTRIESFQQFRRHFGAHLSYGYLAFAVSGFFANGGRACWIVRVADPRSVRTASARIRDERGDVLFEVTASSPGSWGNRLRVSLFRDHDARFSLTVEDVMGSYETFRGLSVGLGPSEVGATLSDVTGGSKLVRVTRCEARFGSDGPPRAGEYLLLGGSDGLASLTLEHFTGSSRQLHWGLAALAPIDEVSVVAIPDAQPVPRPLAARQRPVVYRSERLDVLVGSAPYVEVQAELPPDFDEAAQRALREALVRQCETRKDRVGLIDLPNVGARGDVLLAHRHEITSSYAAAYYPWLLVPDPFGREGPLCAVPPSGHIAGVYARTDLTVGVHRPPANLPLVEVSGVAARMSDALHAELFDAHVNAIVEVYGRGPRVMGARTLSDHDGLRYLNVRRLLIMIASTLEAEGALLIFEPSRGVLRAAVDRVLRTLLERLWLEGALDGESEEEAYTVRMVDAGAPRELDDARVAFEVVLTPPFPSEQVVLRVAFTSLRLEVVEPSEAARGRAQKPIIEAYEPCEDECAGARDSRVEVRAVAPEASEDARVSACRLRDEACVSSREPADAAPRVWRERR